MGKETEKNIINRTTQKGQLQSFFAGFGEKIMQGVKIVGGLAKYVGTPANWGKSGKHIIYDGKQVVNEILGNPVNKNGYVHLTKVEPNSNYFGIKLIGEGGGYLGFKTSDTLINSIARISDAQIKEVNTLNDENAIFDIAINRVAKKIIIEIDVYKIINDITADPDNKGKTKEEIKRLVIGKIIKEADSSLKKLANIVGGEFSKYADSQLLAGVGKRLYQPYEKQKDESKSPAENPTQPSETVLPMSPNVKTGESLNVKDNPQQEEQIKESSFSMTVPCSRLGSYEKLISTNPGLQIKAANVEDVSNNTSNPLPTPNANVKKGPGIF